MYSMSDFFNLLFFSVICLLILSYNLTIYTTNENKLVLVDCLFLSLFFFFSSLYLMLCYDPLTSLFQYVTRLNIFGIYLYFGIDGISLIFIFPTTFFIPLCLVFRTKSVSTSDTMYSICILSIGILVVAVSCTLDLIIFYILFEAILIPFFYMIGVSGTRVRRIHAAYMLMFYTLVGSFLMLGAIIVLYIHTGTSNIQLLWCLGFEGLHEILIWVCFVVSFSIKIPIFPFHLWLPEAHVESPTECSVILAAVLLKLGIYGFLRIVLPLFPELTIYYAPLLICFNTVSLFYTSMITLKQCDMKRIIAYSSIGHMNIGMIGLLLFEPSSIIGSIILMLGHGFVSGGLFFSVGMLYNRYKTKAITYYRGLSSVMPLWSSFFFFFILGNIGFPGTSNFVGEFLVMNSAVNNLNFSILFFFFFSISIRCTYSIWLFNKLTFGVCSMQSSTYCTDLDMLEVSILVPITVMVVVTGLIPHLFIDIFSMNVYVYFSDYYYI